ncbi:anhydro-N-acetylmuramic acid kinase [Aliiglaciecola sp. 2_MG-2023]|uniref:anhydro-N-acetylmuramic acid kinase n=1 Tax=Alteromonadaceae TaxID=72275 RepID=UPI0026E35FDF|nr:MULTISPECIES: anhydro-N-acetylmuramic acid kinase [unclassified Aliiglaciecola]MDO6712470.1 anhydro-N-acetylmuramic acid kinase [Aliiglaciecola sp. 2_MG-2023]MDO6753472.1 anhydro-N-acetylmuramic acid kinase [Aliiglaciecola sp. 1_MG-2023]
MSNLYVGLMSGTSMDGVDVAIVDFSKIKPSIIDCKTYDYPPALVRTLNSLCASSGNELVAMGHADREVAEVFAHAVNDILLKNEISASKIAAIGSHGQTIRHHPCGNNGFTLQIGDPNTIAVLTGIDVIADFRRKDIALGGQGAPLTPAFHQAIFRHSHHSRVILNIGGIANITHIPSDAQQSVLGFDTGPGNTLMDAWCQKHLSLPYDANGAWAAKGSHDAQLLKKLLNEPFFTLPAPKSTGRELFHLAWLEQHLADYPKSVSKECVQTTLAMLTACSIAQQINQLEGVEEVFVCGGGASNDFLMECLENELVECDLRTTDDLGVSPDSVEAIAFAWLAYAFNLDMPGNLPSVTGASRPAVLGAYFPAH